ncbi:DUF58 domain-containing protein [Halomarina oriensis]|uniref:DUF58 domain-containing protein n=1 Tax=Halomarina oriensis TaxID=671145 RepID=UPI00130337BE
MVPVALLAVALGVLTGRPTVLLGAVVAVGFLAYPHVTRPPHTDLSVSRSLGTSVARVDERVTVSLTVRNEGDTPLPDVRLVDGVPPEVPVVDGTARLATALDPGAAVTFEYGVRAIDGTHRFEPATALVRDRAGARELEASVGGSSTLVGGIAARGGSTPTDAPSVGDGRDATPRGSGVEFDRVREYRRGDPPSRIDWRRLARTGERTTVEFADHRAESVLLVVDARPVAARAAADGRHAVGHAAAAAEGICRTVCTDGGAVGLTTLGAADCAVPLGRGPEHRDRLLDTLATADAFRTPVDNDADPPTRLAARVARSPHETHVVCLTPLLDDDLTRTLTRVHAEGRTLTVVSPDVTASGPLSVAMVALERTQRLRRLRAAGVRALDWTPGTSLTTPSGGAADR